MVHWSRVSPRRRSLNVVASARRRHQRAIHRRHHSRCFLASLTDGLLALCLRRSFGTLAEWCEVPVGIVAQIQGHKPSAIAEKHYRVRPIDLLRQWHTKIEAWMLEQAGIQFDASQPQGLRVITAA